GHRCAPPSTAIRDGPRPHARRDRVGRRARTAHGCAAGADAVLDASNVGIDGRRRRGPADRPRSRGDHLARVPRRRLRPRGRSKLEAMVRWKQFAAEAPEFASRVEPALTRGRHLTMATLRADGAPRISGTELEVSDGELWIGSMLNARKARDLLRDGRVAIH